MAKRKKKNNIITKRDNYYYRCRWYNDNNRQVETTIPLVTQKKPEAIRRGKIVDKYIEDIKVGDIVKSFDVGTSSTVNSKVTETYVHSDRYYMIINGIIKTTSVHPFYSDGKWIEAGDLSVGDKILHVDGIEHTIETIELSNEPVTVYNFEVDGTHNYFAEGYLVHNKRQG